MLAGLGDVPQTVPHGVKGLPVHPHAVIRHRNVEQPVPGQPNGKARRYYMNLPRPKEPNEL